MYEILLRVIKMDFVGSGNVESLYRAHGHSGGTTHFGPFLYKQPINNTGLHTTKKNII